MVLAEIGKSLVLSLLLFTCCQPLVIYGSCTRALLELLLLPHFVGLWRHHLGVLIAEI